MHNSPFLCISVAIIATRVAHVVFIFIKSMSHDIINVNRWCLWTVSAYAIVASKETLLKTWQDARTRKMLYGEDI